MKSWIRFMEDSALLVMTLVTVGLVLYLATPPARLWPVVHPAGCHACSGNAPASVIAAHDAELVRIGAIESPSDDQ
jgi:hypothetical protein